jgi:predicted short-subunit dehydrogenase-like oxidoreductase (DUF2520 family)
MTVVIIGTGNVATVLGRKLMASGHRIVEVAGRNTAAVQALAADLSAVPVHDISIISSCADLYLIAVSDSAVKTVVDTLPLDGKTVVHTAAAVSITVLKEKTSNYGVLYPLQSLKKEVRQLPDIPFLIDASNETTLKLLEEVANSISNNVKRTNDSQLVKMHLAAVMVNNFTNHLFALADDYCRHEGLSFSLLLPLISETVNRLQKISPAAAQTGPAVRQDKVTIDRHLNLLQDYPELKQLYSQLTDSILRSAAQSKAVSDKM